MDGCPLGLGLVVEDKLLNFHVHVQAVTCTGARYLSLLDH